MFAVNVQAAAAACQQRVRTESVRSGGAQMLKKKQLNDAASCFKGLSCKRRLFAAIH